MSLNARKVPSTTRPKAPSMEPGAYPARLVQIISLGLQPQQPYQGQDKPPAHEVMFTYEFLDEFMPDDEGNPDEKKPRWLSESIPLYSLDSDMAKSTKRYYALDPTERHKGDWVKLIGTPCMVTIVQRPNKKNPEFPYNNIASTSSMRAKQATSAPDLVNPPKIFDLEEPDLEIFFSLPEWIQTKIKEGLEFEGSTLDEALKSHVEKGENREEAMKDMAEQDAEKVLNDDGDEW